ncbi:MAG: exopolyphosphatase [Gammaproteobacteria bacterium]|nr:exopolyphosphatase [Gammaproteobacteria bacterium]
MVEATTNPSDSNSVQLAAVDLGSNSFHLLVAQETNGRLQIIDRIKEMVRLAEGLEAKNRLSEEVADRALACLERFGQRLTDHETQNVRVVGTNTLRKAHGAKGFLAKAEKALRHKVEIISGQEEARLIFLGVSHAVEDHFDRRLVVDIGGGSTELILGGRFKPQFMESLYIGCVGLSRSCFADGRIRVGSFKAAINQARQQLEPLQRNFQEYGWDTAIGASGTILAIQDVLVEMDFQRDGITLASLVEIKKQLIKARHVDKIALPGLSAERAAVFPGGVAILCAIFEALEIETMHATNGALREGLLYDLLGRVQHQDIRENSVLDLMNRYRIDRPHAKRVRETAIELLAQVAVSWELTEPNDKLLLGWAAQLHEIGIDIAHNQYHKHGGYLLRHMDLPGFSNLDQQHLAALVRAHRHKFPKEEIPPVNGDTSRVGLLAAVLRLAVVLHRNRTSEPLPHVAMSAEDHRVKLALPEAWLKKHPLTRLDLQQEAEYLAAVPLNVEICAS